MNTSLCERTETLIVASPELTELVRGDDQELIERVGPLVRDHSIELDLGKVDRIDAAGISALISLYTRARNSGHAFSVRNVSVRVAEVLKLVGLEPILVSQNAVRASHSGSCLERSAA